MDCWDAVVTNKFVFTEMLVLRALKVDELRIKNFEIVPSAYKRLQPESVHCKLELTKRLYVNG